MNATIAWCLLGVTTVLGNVLPTFDGTSRTPTKLAIIEGDDLWIVRPGSRPQLLSHPEEMSCCELSWSPDGKKLAFVVPMNDIGPDYLWGMDEAGTNARQLTFGRERDMNPTWTAGSRKIVFQRTPGSALESGTVAISVSNRKTSRISVNYASAVSPSGKRVAIHRKDYWWRGSRSDGLWLYDANLKPVRSLVKGFNAEGLTWIDDQLLWCRELFKTHKRKPPTVKHWLLNVNTGKRTCFATTDSCNSYALPPDRRSLAWIKDDRLVVLHLASRNRKTLDSQRLDRDLMWSADGQWIYYSKLDEKVWNGDDVRQVWMVNAQTGQKKRLTSNEDDKSFSLFDPIHHVAFYWDRSRLVIRASPSKSIAIPMENHPYALAPYWAGATRH